jgi:TetR/AcrR family transcriptional repressor of nem operon
VRTAAELFWSQGYAQTGVSSIMKRARATSGSFYHFFPTKDDLLLAVFDAVEEWIETDVLDEAEAGSDDPFGRIAALTAAYRDHTAPGAAGFGLPVGAMVNELGQDHPAALDRVERIYGLLITRVATWVVDAGPRWTGTSDARSLAEFVVGSLEGAALMALSRRSTDPVDACVGQLRLHVDALGGGQVIRTEELPVPTSTDGETTDWKAW